VRASHRARSAILHRWRDVEDAAGEVLFDGWWQPTGRQPDLSSALRQRSLHLRRSALRGGRAPGSIVQLAMAASLRWREKWRIRRRQVLWDDGYATKSLPHYTALAAVRNRGERMTGTVTWRPEAR
jgi:hypothetical protein